MSWLADKGSFANKTRAGRPCHVIALVLLAAVVGCRKEEMGNDARYTPYHPTQFYADASSARPIVEGTVAGGHGRVDSVLHEGKRNGVEVDEFPMVIGMADIERGRQQFEIYCAVCHGRTGDGNGMIVQRGFARPPSYHIDRLRKIPAGHFVNVIANGYGAMYSYNERVTPEDRWRIAAYIRALQVSQHPDMAKLSEEDRAKLKVAEQPTTEPAGQGGEK